MSGHVPNLRSLLGIQTTFKVKRLSDVTGKESTACGNEASDYYLTFPSLRFLAVI